MNEKNTFHIIGAGISGLVVAYELLKKGKNVRIYESLNVSGGLTRTETINDISYDCGPHLFHTNNSEIRRYWQDLLEDKIQTPQLYGANYKDQKIYEYPISFESLKEQFSREEIKFFPYHKSGVFSSNLVKERNLLFVGSGDGTISIWDTSEYKLIQNYKISKGKIRAIQQVNDAIYIGTSEGDLIKIECSDLSVANKINQHASAIYCLTKHKENNTLLIGDKDAHLSVYDLIKNKITISLPAHNWPIYGLEWIGNDFFATCSRDKIVKIWDAQKLEVIQRLSFPNHKGHLSSINNLKYCENNQKLISIGDDKQICVWEIK